jgi:hypothetical protein
MASCIPTFAYQNLPKVRIFVLTKLRHPTGLGLMDDLGYSRPTLSMNVRSTWSSRLLTFSGAAIVAAVVSVAFIIGGRHAAVRGVDGFLLTDVTGRTLPSLFAGIAKSGGAGALSSGRPSPPNGCAASSPKQKSLVSRLLVEDVVHADSCSSDPCGGHYMSVAASACFQGCSGSYVYYYDDGASECWECGWRYNGYTTCPNCGQCAQARCFHQTDPP